MPLWIIEPAAGPDDTAWQDHRRWAKVVVRAPTSGLARRVAAVLDGPGGEASSPLARFVGRSGFESEKLYWVRRYADGHFPEQGPDEVLEVEPPAT